MFKCFHGQQSLLSKFVDGLISDLCVIKSKYKMLDIAHRYKDLAYTFISNLSTIQIQLKMFKCFHGQQSLLSKLLDGLISDIYFSKPKYKVLDIAHRHKDPAHTFLSN